MDIQQLINQLVAQFQGQLNNLLGNLAGQLPDILANLIGNLGKRNVDIQALIALLQGQFQNAVQGVLAQLPALLQNLVGSLGKRQLDFNAVVAALVAQVQGLLQGALGNVVAQLPALLQGLIGGLGKRQLVLPDVQALLATVIAQLQGQLQNLIGNAVAQLPALISNLISGLGKRGLIDLNTILNNISLQIPENVLALINQLIGGPITFPSELLALLGLGKRDLDLNALLSNLNISSILNGLLGQLGGLIPDNLQPIVQAILGQILGKRSIDVGLIINFLSGLIPNLPANLQSVAQNLIDFIISQIFIVGKRSIDLNDILSGVLGSLNIQSLLDIANQLLSGNFQSLLQGLLSQIGKRDVNSVLETIFQFIPKIQKILENPIVHALLGLPQVHELISSLPKKLQEFIALIPDILHLLTIPGFQKVLTNVNNHEAISHAVSNVLTQISSGQTTNILGAVTGLVSAVVLRPDFIVLFILDKQVRSTITSLLKLLNLESLLSHIGKRDLDLQSLLSLVSSLPQLQDVLTLLPTVVPFVQGLIANPQVQAIIKKLINGQTPNALELMLLLAVPEVTQILALPIVQQLISLPQVSAILSQLLGQVIGKREVSAQVADFLKLIATLTPEQLKQFLELPQVKEIIAKYPQVLTLINQAIGGHRFFDVNQIGSIVSGLIGNLNIQSLLSGLISQIPAEFQGIAQALIAQFLSGNFDFSQLQSQLLALLG